MSNQTWVLKCVLDSQIYIKLKYFSARILTTPSLLVSSFPLQTKKASTN